MMESLEVPRVLCVVRGNSYSVIVPHLLVSSCPKMSQGHAISTSQKEGFLTSGEKADSY